MVLPRIFAKGELKILGSFYLIRFFVGLSLMFPAYYVIFFRDLGFSFTQIGLLFFVYGVSSFLFEIPTGVVADSFSRKLSSIIGLIILFFSGLGMYYFTSYLLQICMWAFFSFGSTFLSGAFESWVVSSLAKKRKKKQFLHTFLVKNSAFYALGAVFASLFSSFLVPRFGVPIIFIALSFFVFLAFLLAVFIPEHYSPLQQRSSSYSALRYSFHLSRSSWKFIRSNNVLFSLILASIVSPFLFLGFEVWQPFLLNLGMPLSGLGFQMTLIASLAVVSPFASYFFKRFPLKNVLIGVALFKMFLLGSLFFISPPLFLLAAAIQIILLNSSGLSDPLVESLQHKIIPERMRSTVLSFKSMLRMGSDGLVSILGGVVADTFGMNAALSLGAVFGIVLIIIYFRLKIPKRFV